MGGVTVRRILASVVGATFIGMALPAATSAVVIVYTLVAAPAIATADVVTSFNMTLTNVVGPDDLGCLEVELPAEYEIHAVSDPVASNGRNWSSSSDGNTVVVWSNSGGGRLEILESATFTITARPKEAGVTMWSNHAHRSQDCDDSEAIGIPVEVVVLIPLPTPTLVPTPIPTALPTLVPTPRPTVVPTPDPTTPPVVAPPRPPAATPAPVTTPDPTPDPTPVPTPRPERSPSIESDQAPVGPASGGGPPPASTTSAGTGTGTVHVALDRDEAGGPGALALAAASILVGASVFAVPAAVLGGPGLLLILFVVLQTAGALGWVPAVRRLRGEDSTPA